MNFAHVSVEGAIVVDPSAHLDSRGRFMRAWCMQEFAEHGVHFTPVQANLGYSIRKGTLRGMHFQIDPAPEAKLVRCTRGAIFDVVLDVRPQSPTYRKWFGTELSAENGRMLYLPEGCAHGYQTLEDDTEMYYMASAVFTPAAAKGARFDDPAFGIEWPLPPSIISEQDRNWPLMESSTPHSNICFAPSHVKGEID